MPNCFAALRQKVKVEFEDQSAYKEREPVNRQRPSDPISDAPPTEQDDRAKKQTKGKPKNKKGKPGTVGGRKTSPAARRGDSYTPRLSSSAADGAPDTVEPQPTETVTEVVPSLEDIQQSRSIDEHVTETETESRIKSVTFS